jgi:hypothetical protein
MLFINRPASLNGALKICVILTGTRNLTNHLTPRQFASHGWLVAEPGAREPLLHLGFVTLKEKSRSAVDVPPRTAQLSWMEQRPPLSHLVVEADASGRLQKPPPGKVMTTGVGSA